MLYTLVYSLCLAMLAPVGLYVVLRRKDCRAHWGQRFGLYSKELRRKLSHKPAKRCWIHAVSVGEVNVALFFAAALKRRQPQVQIVLTTTTPDAYALADRRRPEQVELLYFPYDFPPCLRRAYQWIQPDFIVLVEMELWPNHLRMAAQRKAPVFLINARMPAKDARWYRRARWLFRGIFSQLQLVCAQDQDDAERLAALGAPADRLHVTGSLKFDASLPPPEGDVPLSAELQETLKRVGISSSQPIVVAGSTHPGEEAILLDVAAELRPEFPDLFLILAPRHIRRAPQIVALAQRKGLRLLLRSEAATQRSATDGQYDGLLVDTVGELREFYKLATGIFVGKSLVGHGGQNIVEAAASGRPVIFGPHMHNFRAVARQFVAAGAALQVRDARDLRSALRTLLRDPGLCSRIAKAAQRVIQANAGATERTVELLIRALAAKSGTSRQSPPERA